MNMGAFEELNSREIMIVDGGTWSWKEFGQATTAGTVGGAIGGSFSGTITLPVVGTVAGWVGGGILGGVGGAVSYIVCGWW